MFGAGPALLTIKLKNPPRCPYCHQPLAIHAYRTLRVTNVLGQKVTLRLPLYRCAHRHCPKVRVRPRCKGGRKCIVFRVLPEFIDPNHRVFRELVEAALLILNDTSHNKVKSRRVLTQKYKSAAKARKLYSFYLDHKHQCYAWRSHYKPLTTRGREKNQRQIIGFDVVMFSPRPNVRSYFRHLWLLHEGNSDYRRPHFILRKGLLRGNNCETKARVRCGLMGAPP